MHTAATRRFLPLFPLLFVQAFLCFHPIAHAEPQGSQQVADRYEQTLVKSPRAGTTFDRVCDWYASTTGLPALQKRWKDLAESDTASRRSYLILQGLLAQRQGQASQARALLAEALKLEGDKAEAASPLASLETSEGNFAAAIEAYNTALASDSLRPPERLDLMRALALLYQRAFESEKSLEVWRKAITAFPGDASVLEEAGDSFVTAGAYPDAVKAFAQLRDQSSDPQQKIPASLRLARALDLDGKKEEAIAIFENSLEETEGGSWINREARAHIEDFFRRKDDLPGLLAFYEKRLKSAPQDYQTLMAQAVVLGDLGRANEAIESVKAATVLAPDNADLKLALIRLLSNQKRTEEALAVASELAKPADASVQILTVLGNLQWTLYEANKNDSARDAAIAAWMRIAPENSRELSRISQLADLLRSHGLSEEAAKQWQRVIALSPDLPEPRLRLAEIELKKGNRDAAVATLAGLVEGDRAQTGNFVVLTRLQERLELTSLARETARKGLELFPANFDLLALNWRQALDDRDAAAIARLYPLVWQNAPGDHARTEAEKNYVLFLQSQKEAQSALETLRAALETGGQEESQTALLFRLSLEEDSPANARKALDAIKAGKNPVRAAQANYELAQAFGTTDDQIAALQAIAQLEPKLATETLRTAAKLQAEKGDTDTALTTIQSLIARTPVDASLHIMFADIATRAGEPGKAAEQLTKAIRDIDDDTTLRLQLASLLDVQGKTAEAVKVLQEAFEQEPSDARKMEVFRRQIEIAMRAGAVEEFIASLREKQLREQNGARYGAYLAEIFMMQGDFISAREELMRSLGHSPGNAAALTRLIDLTDRSGDQEEGLRLARRLAEIAPSADNRARFIGRLFDSGERESGLEEVQSAKQEILKNPSASKEIIPSMRKAGLIKESNALIEEVVAETKTGIVQKAEIAKLRLLQGDYGAMENLLWDVLEEGDLASSIEAVSGDASPNVNYPQPWMQPFYILANEAQITLQQLSSFSRGRFTFWTSGFQSTSAKATPEQKETVKSLFFLNALADARQDRTKLFERLHTLLADQDVSAKARLTVFRIVGDTEGLLEELRKVANNQHADPDTDKFILTLGEIPGADQSLTKIRERIAARDPEAGLQQQLAQTMAELTKKRSQGLTEEEFRKECRKCLELLLANPNTKIAAQTKSSLANLAGEAGDFETAFRLLNEAQESSTTTQGSAQINRALNDSARGSLVAQAIAAGYPKAQTELEGILATARKSGGQSGLAYSPYGYFISRGTSPLAQANSELTAGVSVFPANLFQFFTPLLGDPDSARKVTKWFANRASATELTPFTAGKFYADWFGGKREEAVRTLEALQARNPSPETAALLFEAYERLNQTENALGIAGLAALQPGETPDIRTLRMVRLLRAAGRKDEARAQAERLARSRVSTSIREPLSAELNILGVPATRYPNLSIASRSQPQRDRTASIRAQLEKLLSEDKKDEAERIAVKILERPLPGPQDYQETNLRQNVVSQLQNMDRLAPLKDKLQQRLDENPSDLNTAIRLAELSMFRESDKALDQLAKFLAEHPSADDPDLAYAFQILQRSRNGRGAAVKSLCTLFKSNPEVLASIGVAPHDLMNFASDKDDGLLLADTIAGMSDDEYLRFAAAPRLSGQYSEAVLLLPLAEMSSQAGKPEQAIKLLERGMKDAVSSAYTGLPLVLRLAELQLARGDKEGAVSTMKSLGDFRGGRWPMQDQTLGTVILNMLMNYQPSGTSTSPIHRLAKLARETGTYEELLAALEIKQQPQYPFYPGLSPALLVRTIVNDPGVENEWRAVLTSKASGGSYLPPSILSIVLKSIVSSKDAKRLVPALIQRIPAAPYGSAELSLRCLTESLPVLETFKDEGLKKQFVAKLVTQFLADPNGPRYLLFSESYASSINALVKAGYVDEARKVFEHTASERASNRYGSRDEWNDLERLFATAPDTKMETEVVCAGQPSGAEKLKVHWQISAGPPGTPSLNESASRVAWKSQMSKLPKSNRPTEIEIFAGPNPAAMKKVARIANPDQAGSMQVKPEVPMGLLQARWKLPDGARRAGPMTVYAIGENLIPDGGVTDPKSSAFQRGGAGPWGKNAISYESVSANHENELVLGSFVPAKAGEQIIALIWTAGTQQRRGMGPRIEYRIIDENGGKQDRGVSYDRVPADEWRQTVVQWITGDPETGTQNLPKNTAKIELVMKLYANSGMNGQYAFEGKWDGLQLVRLPWSDSTDLARKKIDAYQKAASNKEFGAAAEAFSEALRLNPDYALQRPPATVIKVFRESGRMAELFSILSNPALYLANPLAYNRPVLSNPAYLTALIEDARGEKAVPEAKEWLATLKTVDAPERLAFAFETMLLQQGGDAKVTDILSTLGFEQGQPKVTRLRNLWFLEDNGKPTLELLKLIEKQGKNSEALGALQSIEVPGDLQPAKLLAEVWLKAPSDPEGALKTWLAAVDALYGGPRSVSIERAAARALILRIAEKHPNPGEVVAALNTWLAKYRPNTPDKEGSVASILNEASELDTPRKAAYATLWADAELGSLKTPGYQASRERLRKLAFRMMEAGEWQRLDDLLEASKKGNLANDSIQTEFAQLRSISSFARGNLDGAWPVLWCAPGTDARKTVAHWQWNTRDVNPDKGDFDTAVSVADKPILPEIKGQEGIEVLFGELPSTMQTVGRTDGPAAQGSVEANLPAGNGFVRAVAIVNGKRIAGPMVPVVSGRKIYPADNLTLKDLLLSGPTPLKETQIVESGTAPDGSTAFEIAKGQRSRVKYDGPDFPVQAGKFYVCRGWMKRSGSGIGTTSSEFKAAPGSKRGSLNMLLSENQETTGQWVLYSRAVPVLDQFTFWIPMDEVATMSPRLWDVEPGTKIASFELIEVEGWKYADWMRELVLLRKKLPDNPDAASLDRAVEFAAVEPLTALDYEGDWLCRYLPKAGKDALLLDLYRKALSAEANPLYSRPKLGRIFDYLIGVLNRGEGSADFRRNAVQLILDNSTRTSPLQRLATLTHAATLASSPEDLARLSKSTREELTTKLNDKQNGKTFLKAAMSARNNRDDRPTSEMINLIAALDDEETTKIVLAKLEDNPGEGLDTSDRIFATIALQATGKNPSDSGWKDAIARGFKATEDSDSPDSYMRWPLALADYLELRKVDSELVMNLRRESFARVLAAKVDQNGRTTEAIRAGAFLIESSLAGHDEKTARETAEAIVPIIQSGSGKLSELALRVLLRPVNLLAEMGAVSQAEAVVHAAAPDIRRFPKLTTDFAKYLPPES